MQHCGIALPRRYPEGATCDALQIGSALKRLRCSPMKALTSCDGVELRLCETRACQLQNLVGLAQLAFEFLDALLICSRWTRTQIRIGFGLLRAASRPCCRSSGQSTQGPPIATHTRPASPGPGARSAPRPRTKNAGTSSQLRSQSKEPPQFLGRFKMPVSRNLSG